jgi:hypothetical protein
MGLGKGVYGLVIVSQYPQLFWHRMYSPPYVDICGTFTEWVFQIYFAINMI